MARDIPRDKPLSDEDREYLHARGYHETVQMMDERFSAEAPAEDDPLGPEESDDVDYNQWTVEELRGELEDRKMPTSGKKPELVQRLQDDDQRRTFSPQQ